MKKLGILSLFVFFIGSLSAQPLTEEGDFDACNPDLVYKNSPDFNADGTPPNYNGKETVREYFQQAIPRAKFKDCHFVFKGVLNCEGKITDVWVHNSSGDEKLDETILELIRNMKNWSPAIYGEESVDFSVSFLGVVQKKRLIIDTQMNPPREWMESIK